MKNALFIFVFFVFSCNDTSKSSTKETFDAITGKVIKIIDGDTYDILLNGNETVRIRMEGIDAPERGMPYFNVSKKYLSSLCFGQQISLDILDTDSHGRVLAYSYLADGRELSEEMIKAGLAWHFKRYNDDANLANLEIKARENKLGLWKDENPYPPWEIRTYHRNGISTKDSFQISESNR